MSHNELLHKSQISPQQQEQQERERERPHPALIESQTSGEVNRVGFYPDIFFPRICSFIYNFYIFLSRYGFYMWMDIVLLLILLLSVPVLCYMWPLGGARVTGSWSSQWRTAPQSNGVRGAGPGLDSLLGGVYAGYKYTLSVAAPPLEPRWDQRLPLKSSRWVFFFFFISFRLEISNLLEVLWVGRSFGRSRDCFPSRCG